MKLRSGFVSNSSSSSFYFWANDKKVFKDKKLLTTKLEELFECEYIEVELYKHGMSVISCELRKVFMKDVAQNLIEKHTGNRTKQVLYGKYKNRNRQDIFISSKKEIDSSDLPSKDFINLSKIINERFVCVADYGDSHGETTIVGHALDMNFGNGGIDRTSDWCWTCKNLEDCSGTYKCDKEMNLSEYLKKESPTDCKSFEKAYKKPKNFRCSDWFHIWELEDFGVYIKNNH